jgi:hypothetical protein
VTAVGGIADKVDGPATGWHPQAGDGHAAVRNGRQPSNGPPVTARARAHLAAGDIPLFRRLSATGPEPGTGTPPVTARARAHLAAGDIPLFRRLSQGADKGA